jgi:hypothetical protein
MYELSPMMYIFAGNNGSGKPIVQTPCHLGLNVYWITRDYSKNSQEFGAVLFYSMPPMYSPKKAPYSE